MVRWLRNRQKIDKNQILHFVWHRCDLYRRDPSCLGKTRVCVATLARLVLAEYLGMEGDDALDGGVPGRSTCREVGQQRADDLEMGIEIDPVDGEDVFLPLVIDPSRGEARISAERRE